VEVKETMSEQQVREEMRWCSHYNGIPSKVCGAGVNYRDVHPDGFKRIVCVNGDASRCASADFPDRERAIATVERVNEAVAALVAQFESGVCRACGEHYDGKQVGRCVYCEHCNARQYQGTVRAATP
jgi:hypothetical protein